MSNPDQKSSKKTISVGGQAVIEGVMMRAPNAIATAVRRRDGSIEVKHRPFQSVLERFKFANLPVLRGAIALIEMLIIGTKALQYSANAAMEDIEIEERENGNGKPAKPRKENSTFSVVLSTFLALAAGIALFFAGPIYLTTIVFDVDSDAWQFNLIAGVIRIAMFLAYLWGISLIKDVKRIFEYHGAEHKSIYAFENRLALLPENAATFTTLHPRCGTSFLMFVMVVAVLSFAAIDSAYIFAYGDMTIWARFALHLPFVPVVGGISYELIRLSGKYAKNPVARVFIFPGLMLQKITTREPDHSQLEVALAALKSALGKELMDEYQSGNVRGNMSVHEVGIETEVEEGQPS